MKKMITALLLLAMLIQVLPFEALATVGKVLSKEEMARAYALTGLGTGGLKANSNGAYHDGMKPNASWNALQLDDWLEENSFQRISTASRTCSPRWGIPWMR